MITGFCGETEEEHADTVSMMKEIGFDHAFMYLFSMRENTFAWRHFKDDVPLEVKKRRLTEIQDAFYSTLKGKLSRLDGKMELVLVEGEKCADALMQAEMPVLYNEFMLRATRSIRIRLFGFIPVLKIETRGYRTKVYLFEK